MSEQNTNSFPFKYGEGRVIDELTEFIKGTYGSHYCSDDNDIQTLDVFEFRGTLSSTSIDNAIKYQMRYGKKSGKNKKDLIKAIHYLILAIGYDEKTNEFDSDTIYE
jgi:hypothetical protein